MCARYRLEIIFSLYGENAGNLYTVTEEEE